MTPPATQPTGFGLDLWNNSNDVLYMHDLKGRITAVNDTAVQVFGYTEAALLQMSIADLIDPAYLPLAKDNLQAKATGQTDRTGPYELLTRSKDGRPIWVEVSTRVLAPGGTPSAVYGCARVITVRKQAELMSDLVHETALLLNAAPSFEVGVEGALARIATAAGWDYDDGKTLRLGPQWTAGPGLEKFVRLTKNYQYAPGEGLPGIIWNDGKVVWGSQLPGNDEQFPRRAAALAGGLTTFAGLPVRQGDDIVAILVFLGRRAPESNDRWFDAAKKISVHMGASIERRLAAERIRAAARMFAAQFEALDDALLLLDTDGIPRQANQAFLDLCGVKRKHADAAVPLLERLDQPERFLASVADLYEDRSDGRDTVRVEQRTFQRTLEPLRSRSGTPLGMLLRLRPAGTAANA